MPSELRMIVFSEREVTEALIAFDIAHRQSWPEGKIVAVHFQDGDAISIEIELLLINGTHRRIALDAARVAAALIEYCRSKKIPLARQARKSLQVVFRQLSLCLTQDAPDGPGEMTGLALRIGAAG
jgi:hypothetical protein